jgi:hypothetical protein
MIWSVAFAPRCFSFEGSVFAIMAYISNIMLGIHQHATAIYGMPWPVHTASLNGALLGCHSIACSLSVTHSLLLLLLPSHGLSPLLLWPCRQEAVGPIEFLRQHNLTVLTKRSAFEPRFHLAFTDPQHDIDASKDFVGFSTLEQKLSHIAYHVLHGPCQQGVAIDGSTGSTSSMGASGSTEADHHQQQQQQQLSAAEGLVLDVGAGFGWYSLLAGMLGCR